MATKAQQEDILATYKSHITTLEGLVSDLRKAEAAHNDQIERLQNALIATASPEAYRDQRMDETGEPDRMSAEERRKSAQIHEIQADYIRRIEDPTFTSAEDLQDRLGGMLMAEAIEPKPSLNGNEES